jgi:hypothetical protein
MRQQHAGLTIEQAEHLRLQALLAAGHSREVGEIDCLFRRQHGLTETGEAPWFDGRAGTCPRQAIGSL